jgi:hypothetical protein
MGVGPAHYLQDRPAPLAWFARGHHGFEQFAHLLLEPVELARGILQPQSFLFLIAMQNLVQVAGDYLPKLFVTHPLPGISFHGSPPVLIFLTRLPVRGVPELQVRAHSLQPAKPIRFTSDGFDLESLIGGVLTADRAWGFHTGFSYGWSAQVRSGNHHRMTKAFTVWITVFPAASSGHPVSRLFSSFRDADAPHSLLRALWRMLMV